MDRPQLLRSTSELAALCALLALGCGGDMNVGTVLDAGAPPPAPVADECGNGLDDDDDARIDEGCFCGGGETQECFPEGALGACGPGSMGCGDTAVRWLPEDGSDSKVLAIRGRQVYYRSEHLEDRMRTRLEYRRLDVDSGREEVLSECWGGTLVLGDHLYRFRGTFEGSEPTAFHIFRYAL